MKPLVIIPSYNTGNRLQSTVRDVLTSWDGGPVWIVIDGSNDGSDNVLERESGANKRLRIIRRSKNEGKGKAVIFAAEEALAQGYTHACVFDADGQHNANDIGPMFGHISEESRTMVLGVPVFGPEAPPARVKGRRVGNTFAKIETLWHGPQDSLFGMRVYPLADLARLMKPAFRGRRYEFDTEASVRLAWSGVMPINFPTPVRYISRAEGGVSHFRYLRDNVLLFIMHTRLLVELPFRAPLFIIRSRRWNKLPNVTSRNA